MRRSRQIDAKSSEKGIVRATMRAPLILPRKRSSTSVTSMKAVRQVVQDCMGRVVDEVAPVVEGDDLHARRQDAAIQLLHLLRATPSSVCIEVCAFPHEHDAGDYVAVVDDLAVLPSDRPAELAQTYLRALRYDGDVLDPHGRAVLGRDDRILDVLHVADQPDRAHVDLLHARLYEAAARVHVVVRELLLHLADGEAVGDELVRVDADLVFPGGTAEDSTRPRRSGHGLELLHQHPVLQGLQLHGVVCGVRAPERIKVDLADGAEVGADLRLKARRKADHREALQHPLPVPDVVRIVVEYEDHDGQPGNRYGPQVGEVGDAVHHVFEGDRDLLLHLLGRPAGPLGDDPGVIVGDVGIGLDREMVEGNMPPPEEKEARRPAQSAGCSGRNRRQRVSSYLSIAPAVAWSASAFATTFWPGLIPVTSCSVAGKHLPAPHLDAPELAGLRRDIDPVAVVEVEDGGRRDRWNVSCSCP